MSLGKQHKKLHAVISLILSWVVLMTSVGVTVFAFEPANRESHLSVAVISRQMDSITVAVFADETIDYVTVNQVRLGLAQEDVPTSLPVEGTSSAIASDTVDTSKEESTETTAVTSVPIKEEDADQSFSSLSASDQSDSSMLESKEEETVSNTVTSAEIELPDEEILQGESSLETEQAVSSSVSEPVIPLPELLPDGEQSLPQQPEGQEKSFFFVLTKDGNYTIDGCTTQGDVVETMKYAVKGLQKASMQVTHEQTKDSGYSILTVTSFFGATKDIICRESKGIIAYGGSIAVENNTEGFDPSVSRTFRLEKNGKFHFIGVDSSGEQVEGAALTYEEHSLGELTIDYQPDQQNGGYLFSLQTTLEGAQQFAVHYDETSELVTEEKVSVTDWMMRAAVENAASRKTVTAQATLIEPGEPSKPDESNPEKEEIPSAPPEAEGLATSPPVILPETELLTVVGAELSVGQSRNGSYTVEVMDETGELLHQQTLSLEAVLFLNRSGDSIVDTGITLTAAITLETGTVSKNPLAVYFVERLLDEQENQTERRTAVTTVHKETKSAGFSNYEAAVTIKADNANRTGFYEIEATDDSGAILRKKRIFIGDRQAGETPAPPNARQRVTAVRTVEDLLAFRDSVNGGDSYAGETVTLQAGLDLRDVAWNEAIGTDAIPFAGTFTGVSATAQACVVTIANLNGTAGLFGRVEGGTLRGISLTAPRVTVEEGSGIFTTSGNSTTSVNSTASGILAETVIDTTIAACEVENGKLFAAQVQDAGGLLGTASNADIRNCSVFADVTVSGSATDNFGGIAGNIDDSRISGSLYAGTMTAGAVKNMGGIAGTVSGKSDVADCLTTGSLNANDSSKEGNSNYGGIAGKSDGVILSCQSGMKMRINPQYANVGGAVGLLDADGAGVRGCLITTSMDVSLYHGAQNTVGGIAGRTSSDSQSKTFLEDCIFAGNIGLRVQTEELTDKAGRELRINAGSLLGSAYDSAVSIKNFVYDDEMSNLGNWLGENGDFMEIDGVTPLSTAVLASGDCTAIEGTAWKQAAGSYPRPQSLQIGKAAGNATLCELSVLLATPKVKEFGGGSAGDMGERLTMETEVEVGGGITPLNWQTPSARQRTTAGAALLKIAPDSFARVSTSAAVLVEVQATAPVTLPSGSQEHLQVGALVANVQPRAFVRLGSGTVADPYQIASLADFKEYTQRINANDPLYFGKQYKVTADFDFGSEPLTTLWMGSNPNGFIGTFDGNGKRISFGSAEKPVNLTAENTVQGLFHTIGGGGVVKNLKRNVFAKVNREYGCVAMTVEKGGTISGCLTTGVVSSKDATMASGIAVSNKGSISSCTFGVVTNTIVSTTEYGSALVEYVSADEIDNGIVGSNAGTVTLCGVYGNAKQAGIAAQNSVDGRIAQSFFVGKMAYTSVGADARPADAGAGIVQKNDGKVELCFSGGTVLRTGLAGENNGTVINCYSVSQIAPFNMDLSKASNQFHFDDGTNEANGYNYRGYARSEKAGLVFTNNGRVENCYFSGHFLKNKTGYSGTLDTASLVFENNGTIANTFANEDIYRVSHPMIITGSSLTGGSSIGTGSLANKFGNITGWLQTWGSGYPQLNGFAAEIQKAITVLNWSQAPSPPQNEFPDSGTDIQSMGDKKYNINSAKGFTALAAYVNNADKPGVTLGYTFTLTMDVTLTGNWITPIGTLKNPFRGTLNGGGHTISNLTIQQTGGAETLSYAGLFGVTSAGCSIRDIKLANVTVNNENGGITGSLVGLASRSNIENCTVTFGSSYRGFSRLGGLAGILSSSDVSNCLVNGDISGTNDSKSSPYRSTEIGGIAGVALNGTTLKGCAHDGDITLDIHSGNSGQMVRKGSWVGGITGAADGLVLIDTYSIGDITVTDVNEVNGSYKFALNAVGGLAGVAKTTAVTDCFVKGNISLETQLAPPDTAEETVPAHDGYAQFTGGLIGYDGVSENSTISQSFYYGNMQGANWAGGIAGYTAADISKVYARGVLNGNYQVGGITGTAAGQIADSYSTMNVSGRGNIGGITGISKDGGDGAKLVHCYADKQLNSGTTQLAGNVTAEIQAAKPEMGRALTTNQFTKNRAELETAWSGKGWSFGENNYPQISGFLQDAHGYKKVSYYSTLIIIQFFATEDGENYDKYTAVTEPFHVTKTVDGRDVDWSQPSADSSYPLIVSAPSAKDVEENSANVTDASKYFTITQNGNSYQAAIHADATGKFYFRFPKTVGADVPVGTTHKVDFFLAQEIVKSPFDKIITTEEGKTVIREGDGTKENPFLIASEYTLMRFAQYVASGSDGNDVYYQLVRGMEHTVSGKNPPNVALQELLTESRCFDLSLPSITGYRYNTDGTVTILSPTELAKQVWWSGTAWAPIGAVKNGSAMRGNLLGSGQTIANMTVPDGNNVGFIGSMSGGSVNGLTLRNVKVGSADSVSAAGENIGALVGNAAGNVVIERVIVEGIAGNYVHGLRNVGGMVGTMTGGKIHDSGVNLPVEGMSNVGGLIGNAGGNTLTLSNSYATGGISRSGSSAGGLVGRGSVGKIEVTGCFAAGDITATGEDAGGLFGLLITTDSGSHLFQSFATGSVTAKNNAGGFLGRFVNRGEGAASQAAKATVEQCYALGQIYGSGSNVGGFAGVIENDKPRAVNVQTKVINCYATGSAQGAENAGGFVGLSSVTETNKNKQTELSFQNCYAAGRAQGSGNTAGFAGSLTYTLLNDWLTEEAIETDLNLKRRGVAESNYRIKAQNCSYNFQSTGCAVGVGGALPNEKTVFAPQKYTTQEMVDGKDLAFGDTAVWKITAATADTSGIAQTAYLPQLAAFFNKAADAAVVNFALCDEGGSSGYSTQKSDYVRTASLLSAVPLWLPNNAGKVITADNLMMKANDLSYDIPLKQRIVAEKTLAWSSSNPTVIRVEFPYARLIAGTMKTDIRLGVSPAQYGLRHSYLVTVDRTLNRWTDDIVLDIPVVAKDNVYRLTSDVALTELQEKLTLFLSDSGNQAAFLSAYGRAAALNQAEPNAITNFLEKCTALLFEGKADGSLLAFLNGYLVGGTGVPVLEQEAVTALQNAVEDYRDEIIRAQLVWIAKQWFYDRADFAGKRIVIDENVEIDLSGRRWYPLGGGFVGEHGSSQPKIGECNTAFQGEIQAGTGKQVTIVNLMVDEYDVQPYAGFFGELGKDGGLADIRFVNPRVYTTYDSTKVVGGTLNNAVSKKASAAGVIAGYNSGSIQNCSVLYRRENGEFGTNQPLESVLLNDSRSIKLPGMTYVGGLAGVNGKSGKIEDCTLKANLYSYGYHTGGFAGGNSGVISGGDATGILTVVNTRETLGNQDILSIGGIAGVLPQDGWIGNTTFGGKVEAATVSGISFNGNLNQNGTIAQGGIVGRMTASPAAFASVSRFFSSLFGTVQNGVTNCSVNASVLSNTGTQTNASAYLGGVTGVTSSPDGIDNTGTIANITEASDMKTSYVGGVVGFADNGSLTASYANGQIASSNSAEASGTSASLGGLAGSINHSGYISDCFSFSPVTRVNSGKATVDMGGAVGFTGSGNAVTTSFAGGNLAAYADGNSLVNMGGVAGRVTADSAVTTCYSLNTITRHGKATTWLGGLVGSSASANCVRDCYTAATTVNNEPLGTVYQDPIGSGVTNGKNLFDRQLCGIGTMENGMSPRGRSIPLASADGGVGLTTAALCADSVAGLSDKWLFDAKGYPQLKGFSFDGFKANGGNGSASFSAGKMEAAAYNASRISTSPPADFGDVPTDWQSSGRGAGMNSILNTFKPVKLPRKLGLVYYAKGAEGGQVIPVSKMDTSFTTSGLVFESREDGHYASIPENVSVGTGAISLRIPVTFDGSGKEESSYQYERTLALNNYFPEGNGSGLQKLPFVIDSRVRLDRYMRDATDTVLIQAANLDLSGLAWKPFPQFTGNYYGNNYYIGNFRSTSGGLFEQMADARVENIALVNASVTSGGESAGVLANTAVDSVIADSYVYGELQGKGRIGGFVGTAANTTLERSFTTGSMQLAANGTATQYAGGLLGKATDCVVSQSYSTMTVDVTAAKENAACSAGGLAGGFADGSISNSYYAGTVKTAPVNGAVKNQAGAILGSSNGMLTNATLTNVYFDQMVSGVVETGAGLTAYPCTPGTLSALKPEQLGDIANIDNNVNSVWEMTPNQLYPQLRRMKTGKCETAIMVKSEYLYENYAKRDETNLSGVSEVTKAVSAMSALPVFCYNKIAPWMITAFSRAQLVALVGGESRTQPVLYRLEGNGDKTSALDGTGHIKSIEKSPDGLYYNIKANPDNAGSVRFLAYLDRVSGEGVNGQNVDKTPRTEETTAIRRIYGMESTAEIGVHVRFDTANMASPQIKAEDGTVAKDYTNQTVSVTLKSYTDNQNSYLYQLNSFAKPWSNLSNDALPTGKQPKSFVNQPVTHYFYVEADLPSAYDYTVSAVVTHTDGTKQSYTMSRGKNGAAGFCNDEPLPLDAKDVAFTIQVKAAAEAKWGLQRVWDSITGKG